MNPVQFYKCLADETRLRMLLLLQQDELCVCELMASLQESQPKVSRHLAMLRQCGLLSDRREGQWIYYSLHPALATWAVEVIQVTARNNQPFLQQSHQNLAAMGERPQRKKSCC